MEISHQIRGTMAQVLAASSNDAARTFIYKHLGITDSGLHTLREILEVTTADAIQPMLVELLAANKVLRAAAPIKHVFDDAVNELGRWALHDGWTIEGTVLIRVAPLAEEVTGIRDKLTEDLATSGLDEDGAIRAALEGSSKDFVALPPDFNGSITKTRIALETVARRAAERVAGAMDVVYPENSWGKALAFLKAQAVIEKTEEDILARVYTFTSPGAHIPKGITAEEWARLARTFSVSSAYFLLRKITAALK